MTQNTARTIRLLIVDNSPTARERLCGLFDPIADIDVVGEAATADKALCLVEEVTPSVILVDCDLPNPGSYAAVWEIMSGHPVPIVMMSKQADAPVATLESQALNVGAVAFVTWTPTGSDARASGDRLISTVRAMSEVKVVRRRNRRSQSRSLPPEAIPPPSPARPATRIEVVAIGASTGGPPVLQTILRGLTRPVPVPILLVQHLSPGFQASMVAWLSESTGTRICVGEHGMPLRPGLVYLAPDNRHMTVNRQGRLVLNDDPPENGSRPSVSALFRSVAQHYGANAIGILLTGMGRDGAKELRLMRDKGAVTIAQDEETSVVYGMPGEAIKLKSARYILSPNRIAHVVEQHVSVLSNGKRGQGALPLATC
ncbi:MAG: response regulator [Actinobacteria bacterium]|nr:response regulator [Actinomycetota bacterium]